MLGYSTGCCQCFNPEEVGEVIGSERVMLMMGIGFPDKSRNRRVDMKDNDFTFPTFTKDIKVEYIS